MAEVTLLDKNKKEDKEKTERTNIVNTEGQNLKKEQLSGVKQEAGSLEISAPLLL